MTFWGPSCIISKSARAEHLWRSRVAGRARTIGNRVYPKRVSRVQIPPSPPKRGTPKLLRLRGFSFLYDDFAAWIVRIYRTVQAASLFFSLGFSLTENPGRFLPYLLTALMNCSIRAALSCCIFSVTWPYTSRVKDAVAWPRCSCTVLISSPERMEATA